MAQKNLDDKTQWNTQRENLLIAIDQLEQITEVMGQVLGRVKQQMHELEETNPKIEPAKTPPTNKKTKTKTINTKKANVVH